ncbi:MAG: ABC transporter permease [Bacteroidales bacterium]|nr:ABC transporter permease [Bacteroidales bacterium]
MKRFIGFVIKEFNHILRDYRTMIILFGIPVAQIIIFGYVVRNEIQDVKIAILDLSKDEVTQELTNKILSSNYFILYKNLENNNEIEEVFKTGKVNEVIIFEPGFSQNLEKEGTANIQLLADASDPNFANLVTNYTNGIINNYVSELNKNSASPFTILPNVRFYFNPELKSAYMFIPGTIALILMLVSAIMTSISIAREKELGTMEVLLVSPLKPLQIILGKVTPYVLLSFINALVILALGNLVFHIPVRGSMALFMIINLLYIVLALSLGILISTFSNSQQTAMFVSMFALMLPTMLLSGFIFPIENMPKVLQVLSNLMPARWFLAIIKNIMIKGTGLLYVWKETLILIGFIVFFIAVSTRKFKYRLE